MLAWRIRNCVEKIPGNSAAAVLDSNDRRAVASDLVDLGGECEGHVILRHFDLCKDGAQLVLQNQLRAIDIDLGEMHRRRLEMRKVF